jgi:sugar/nucleoside kinase (ribokinase family)
MHSLLDTLPETTVRAPGGSAANTVVGVARLGMGSRLLAKVGRDEAGDYYRHHLVETGVDTASLKTDDVLATGTCISLVTPDSERTMRTFLGASASLNPDDITAVDFSDGRYVHIEGYLAMNPPLFRYVIDTAAACGCTVCLDLASPEVVATCREGLDYALSNAVEVVFANADEAAAYAGTDDAETALKQLSTHCEVAAVKLGARGALVDLRGTIHRAAAEKVTAVDTTGAGDLWAAGFLYGLACGMPLDEMCALAAALGAAAVQQTGATLDEATWIALRDRFDLDTNQA